MSSAGQSLGSKEYRKDLSGENIPDIRRLLKEEILDDDLEGIQELLVLVDSQSVEWWGVLKNRVLIKLPLWRVLFTAVGGEYGVLIEFFPSWVYAFPPKDCPWTDLGFYFRFFVTVEALAGIRETLLSLQDRQTDFARLYHGQAPKED